MKRIASMVLAWAMIVCAARAETVAGPAVMTKSAYRAARQHFGFTPDTVREQEIYLAPDLYAALMKKAKQPVPKGDAPDIEGDVFFDAQDLPDKFEVGEASIDGTNAKVPVSVSWGNEKRLYIVFLAQFKGGWVITDIDYGKDGKLSDLLK